MPTIRFDYTGAEVQWQVPAGATGNAIQVKLTGAQGGSGDALGNTAGALGALLQITLAVTPSEFLLLRVGGMGQASTATGTRVGGYFGAGAGSDSNEGSGGGASDIRQGGTAESNRVAVAAGAGGTGNGAPPTTAQGGQALDTQAIASVAVSAQPPTAGTGAGPGGGWRVGAYQGSDLAGLGGTSMAHSTQTSGVTHTTGANTGNGYIEITYTLAQTVAQKFFYSTTDQDFTAPGEVDIRKLVETAPGTNSTTICTHPNAAGTTQITLDPYSNSSTASDIRANAGFAINRLGVDGIVSTANVLRVFPAGVWTITKTVAIPAPATLGSLTVSMIPAVYRVSSAGARTLLFTSAESNTVTTSLAAASGLLTSNSASQPEIVLQPNETIEEGTISKMVQVAGALGATVSGVATYTLGTTAEFVNLPGTIKFRYVIHLPVQLKGVGTLLKRIPKRLNVTMKGVPFFSRKLTVRRPMYNTNGTPDSSSHGRHGTFVGTTKPVLVVAPVAGFGNALQFDGVNSGANSCGLDCGADGTGMSGAFCFEYCAKIVTVAHAPNSDSHMGRWGTATSAQNFKLGWTNGGGSQGHVRRNTGATASVTGAGVLVDGQIIEQALDYDGTTLRLFRDGVLKDSIAVAGLQAPDAVTPLMLGRVNDSTAPEAMAAIIYCSRLSNASRYNANYTTSTTPFVSDANTVALYHLDDYTPLLMKGVPTLSRILRAHRTLSAVMKGVAPRIVLTVKKPMVVTMKAVTPRIVLKVTKKLTVTMKGVPTISKVLIKRLNATMKGVASLQRIFRGKRILSATMKMMPRIFVSFDITILSRISSGAIPYPDGLLRLNSSGQIESISSGSGPLPAGTLYLTETPPP